MKKKNIFVTNKYKASFLFFGLFFFRQTVFSQPYLDLISLQGNHVEPSSILSTDTAALTNDLFSFQVTYPHRFKNKNVLAVAVGYDYWKLKSENESQSFHTGYLPVTFIKTFNEKWKGAVTFIPRFNAEANQSIASDFFQTGAAVVATHVFSDKLKLKAGLYYNNEFFGNYFLPLIGGEWKINERFYLFGLLPNNLIADYKFSQRIHAGFAYKGITTSFRYATTSLDDYLHLEEGQVKLFAELYLSSKFVFNMEAGHTLARAYNIVTKKGEKSDLPFKEGAIFKIGIAYRIWL